MPPASRGAKEKRIVMSSLSEIAPERLEAAGGRNEENLKREAERKCFGTAPARRGPTCIKWFMAIFMYLFVASGKHVLMYVYVRSGLRQLRPLTPSPPTMSGLSTWQMLDMMFVCIFVHSKVAQLLRGSKMPGARKPPGELQKAGWSSRWF